jgi:hypothetical protein
MSSQFPSGYICFSVLLIYQQMLSCFMFIFSYLSLEPIPVATQSKAAAWLLGSRVRIPLGAWMFVSRVYMLFCPVQVEVSATG